MAAEYGRPGQLRPRSHRAPVRHGPDRRARRRRRHAHLRQRDDRHLGRAATGRSAASGGFYLSGNLAVDGSRAAVRDRDPAGVPGTPGHRVRRGRRVWDADGRVRHGRPATAFRSSPFPTTTMPPSGRSCGSRWCSATRSLASATSNSSPISRPGHGGVRWGRDQGPARPSRDLEDAVKEALSASGGRRSST